jgi:hypothetical protein
MRFTPSTTAAALLCVGIAARPAAAAANDPLLHDGLFADGTRVTGVPIAGWNAPASQPQLGGRPMFDAANPVRWVVRQDAAALRPVATPQPFIELAGGDRLPGIIEGHASGVDDWRHALSSCAASCSRRESARRCPPPRSSPGMAARSASVRSASLAPA